MFEKLIQDTKKYFLLSGIIIIIILLLEIVIYLIAGMQGLYITGIIVVLIFGLLLWIYVILNSKRRKTFGIEPGCNPSVVIVNTNDNRRGQRESKIQENPLRWNWNLKNIFK